MRSSYTTIFSEARAKLVWGMEMVNKAIMSAEPMVQWILLE